MSRQTKRRSAPPTSPDSADPLAGVAELLALVLPDSNAQRTLPAERLRALAIRHSVVGELIRYARSAGDDDLVESLRDEDRRRRLRLMLNATTVAAVHGVLNELGVEHVFLKGLGLAALTRPEPEDRTTNDIDVLVPPSQARRVVEALTERGGYVPEGRMPIDDSISARAYLGLRAEALVMFSQGPVDLHWRAGPDRFVYPGTEACLNNVVQVAAFGVQFPTLEPSVALWHAGLHLRGTGYRRIRHILDVAVLGSRISLPREAPRVASVPVEVARALADAPQALIRPRPPVGVSARHWAWMRAGLQSDLATYGLASRARSGVEILRFPTSLRMVALSPVWVPVGPAAKALHPVEQRFRGRRQAR